MPKILVNGVRLNYEEWGSGPQNVILGHGWGSSARSWDAFQALFPETYSLYALDMRGFGKSANVTEKLSTPQMADDVYQFSRELRLENFVYIGLSMGGRVGLDLVIRHPEVVKAAVLISPPPAHGYLPSDNFPTVPYETAIDPNKIRTNLEFLLVRPSRYSEVEMNRAIEDTHIIKRVAYAQLNDFTKLYPNVEASLNQIKTPVMMVIGGQDRIIPPDEDWRTIKQIPSSRAVFYQAEGHLMVWENPQKLVNEISIFLEQTILSLSKKS